MKNSKKVLVGLLAVSMTAVLSACQNPISSSISSTSSSEGVTSTNSSIISTESTPNTSSEVSSESSTVSSIEVVAVKTEIATVEDFLAFRAINNAEDAALDFKLTADIDLTGVTLPAPKIVLTGSFDGQGHTIKNAAYENANSKTGILFAKVAGGIVKNVNFFACTISSSAESIAILAGEINGGNVTNCEFNNCKVDTTGNYGGIVYARSEGSNMQVTLDQITVKNNCLVSCGQYGGVVCGDNAAGTKVTLTNSHIIGKLTKSSNNYGLLLGRERDANHVYTVENVIVDVSYDGNVGTIAGLVCRGNSACPINMKNVFIINSNVNVAGPKGVLTAENVVYLDSASLISTGSGISTISLEEATSEWLKNSLLDNFDEYWVIEDETHVKLKDASPNIAQEGESILSIDLITTNAKTRFKKGEEFVSDGLSVSATYESGITVPLSLDKVDIISSSFNKDAAGQYEITVKVKESDISKKYTVNVVEQTGFEIDDEFVKHSYIIGESLDSSRLVATSTWSDGKVETMSVSELTIDASNFDNTKEGTYDIIVKCGSFATRQFTVQVTATEVPTPVNNTVNVTVDGTYNGVNGAVVEERVTFNSIQNALDFYKSCGYASSVKKVINIKEGTYREKLTIDIDNVIFVGESRENTKIVYNAVESTIDPVTNKPYVLNCATVHVNAQGFEAHTISIYNDFDYKNNQYNPQYSDVKESSPQGLALTLNGDKFVLRDCHLYGNQDTLYLKAGRAYFDGGIIEGNIDFIFGEAKGIGFFDKVNINAVPKGLEAGQMKNNGYVTAMKGDTGSTPAYGLVFSQCSFTADEEVPDGSMSLGRPWGPKATVAYINCSFTKAYSTAAYDGKAKSRWADMSGNSPVNANFVEYGSTGEGAIEEAVAGGKILTAEQAALYTMENVFAETNGDFSFPAAFNPNATEEVEDKNTYYYFNGSSSSTGTSYTYDLNVQGRIEEDWNGIKIDATQGKVTARSTDTQINAGAKLTFTVPANSILTIETYPGYHNYQLDGNETYMDQYKVYYIEEKEVTFTALETVYLYSIIIKPDQKAPEAPTSREVKVLGTPTSEFAVGSELDLSKIKVQDYLTDGTILNLKKDVDYTIDTSKVDINAAGTYEVVIKYGDVEKTFTVTYVSTYDPSISSDVTFSFKDDVNAASENYIVYDNSAIEDKLVMGKLTLIKGEGTIADNGDWLKFYRGAKATFTLAREATMTLTFYQNQATVTVTVNGNEVTANANGTYTLPAGDVVITGNGTGTEYIGKISLVLVEPKNPIESDVTFSFKDDVNAASENYIVYDNSAIEDKLVMGKLTLIKGEGTIADNGDWLKFYRGAKATFTLAREAIMTLTFYENKETVTVTVNGNEITANVDGTYTLPAGDVVITGNGTGTEYIGMINLVLA